MTEEGLRYLDNEHSEEKIVPFSDVIDLHDADDEKESDDKNNQEEKND